MVDAAGSAPTSPPTPTDAIAGATPPTQSTPAPSVPPYRFSAARWTSADRISGVATFLLFVSLFLPWFTRTVASTSHSLNSFWHGWMYITLILCILVVAYLMLRAGWDTLPIDQDVPHVGVMMTATIVNAVLTLIAFFDKPNAPGVGWGFGAVLGLVAAVVAAAPYAVPQLRAKTTA